MKVPWGLTSWAVRSLRRCPSFMICRCGRGSRKRSGDLRRTWSWRACLASSSSVGWTLTGSPCRGEWRGRRPSGLEEPTPTAGGSPGRVLEGTFRILVVVGSSLYDNCFPAMAVNVSEAWATRPNSPTGTTWAHGGVVGAVPRLCVCVWGALQLERGLMPPSVSPHG